MQRPLKITCRNIEHSASIDGLVHDREASLEHYCEQITACHVFVEALTGGRKGRSRLRVRINLDVPGKRLVVVTDEPRRHAGDEACAAIRHAFHDLQVQLEQYLCRAKRDYPAPRRGRISELFLGMNYGTIVSADGNEVYFHRNSVLDDAFDRLEPGTPVKFIEETGLLGPQATTVKVMGLRREKQRTRRTRH
jgi:cold shock CspA family protein/ribosome-associated translation inhibitor RaiA